MPSPREPSPEPERPPWERVDALFSRALELDPGERAAFLDEACGEDAALRRTVEELLAGDEEAEGEGFLERPAVVTWQPLWEGAARGGAGEADEPDGSERTGQRLGPWHLEEVIGRGGMATVYRARRADGEFEQEVAVKVLRPSLAADRMVRRIRAEREILSGLSHPNVARLLDGGTTPDGLPYLVMELVEGRPITAYCNEEGLGLEARLGLFLDVVEAVEHAHRRLVLHRDLKPSNILVTGQGRVRLLDFGIAKLLDPEATDGGPTLTRPGTGPLTPEYASPEQIRGEPVTTASDVYQLGVLLYRLLAGRRPYRLESATLPGLLRSFEEVEIVPPSESAAGEGGAGPDRARRLRGDLDTVVMKALEEDPERRYASVGALAEDIRRHLAGLPIAARRPTVRYRLRKFVGRNPWPVAAGLAALVALGGFGLVQARNAERLATERDRARRAQARAEEVRDFTVGLFELADPVESRGEDVTARELLEAGAEDIRRELVGQPRLRADMLSTMADIYFNIGIRGRALALAREALEVRRETLPPDDPDRAASELQVANLAVDAGEADTPEGFRRALEWVARADGRRSAQMADAYHLTAMNAPGLSEEERRALDDSAIAVLEALGPEARPEARLRLARVLVESTYYTDRGRAADSARLWRALEIERAVEGGESAGVAAILADIGTFLESRDPDRAVDFTRRAFKMHRDARGPRHPTTLTIANNLAGMYRDRAAPGDLAAAEGLYRQLLAVRREVSEDPAALAYTLYGLGRVLVEQGRGGEAEPYLREIGTLDIFAPDDVRHALVQIALGRALLEQGRWSAAETTLRRSTRELEEPVPEDVRRERLEALSALYERWDRPGERAEVMASLEALDGPDAASAPGATEGSAAAGAGGGAPDGGS